MKKIKGKEILKYHIERLNKVSLPTVVATSDLGRDEVIVDFCKEHGFLVSRSDEKDVLKRYAYTADKFNFDPIVRVTSDCPLISPLLIKYGLKKFKQSDIDFFESTFSNNIPHGFDFQIMDRDLLNWANNEATKPYDREHVIPYIKRNENINEKHLELNNDYSWIRITVDHPEDLELLATLIEDFDADQKKWCEIIKIFLNNQKLTEVNKSKNKNKKKIKQNKVL